MRTGALTTIMEARYQWLLTKPHQPKIRRPHLAMELEKDAAIEITRGLLNGPRLEQGRQTSILTGR